MGKPNISEQYLQIRNKVLYYTNIDMNLKLEEDNQVYIAVFDIPVKSGIVGLNLQTIALVFGLNTYIFWKWRCLDGTGEESQCDEGDAVIVNKFQSGIVPNADH